MAIRVLVTVFLLAFSSIAPSMAQATIKHRLNISQRPLGAALAELARQAKIQVIYSTDLVEGLEAPAVQGDMTPEDALKLILPKSGLGFEFVDANTITLVMLGADTGASGQEDSNLEEVVVTAQKRAERLQDVPMSITALTGEDISRRGLVDRSDYLRSVPGVNLIDQGPGLNTVVIRGAYGEAFNTGPTVGIYLGDVPLTGHALGSSTDVILTDIERVEVLRGPQGSLYGSNSLSGTVRYIPRAPNLQSFASHVEAGYSVTAGEGDNNTKLQGVLNIPLIADKLGMRAVAYRHENDGYYRNVAGSDPSMQAAASNFGAQALAVDKENVGGSSYTGGRLSTLWQPLEQLDFTLTYLKQITTQEDRPFEQTQYAAYRLADYQFGGPGAGDDALEIDMDIVHLAAELDLPWGSLISSTAWIDQDWTRIWDIGSFFTGRPPVTQMSFAAAEVFTQEVRLTSALHGPFQFITGLYYEDSEVPYTQPTYYVGNPAQNPWSSTTMWDSVANREVKQKAAFGELSYQLSEQWSAMAGGRAFNYDSRFFLNRFGSVVPNTPNAFSDVRSEESGETYKAGLDFKPSEDTLVYARFSQGFRLGRPLAVSSIIATCDQNNDGVIDGTNISSAVDKVSSDTLESVELGTKLRVMSGRATLNASVYNNDWTDIPVNISFFPTCLVSTTINGGTARARGAELEGGFSVTDNLRLELGVGYVDSYLTATTSAGSDGDRMNYTPEFNGVLSAEYSFSLRGHDAFVRSDYTRFGSFYTGTGERGFKVDGYGQANLNAGIKLNQLTVQLQVSNLTDSDAYTTIGSSSASGGFPGGYALRLRPRTAGFIVGYSF